MPPEDFLIALWLCRWGGGGGGDSRPARCSEVLPALVAVFGATRVHPLKLKPSRCLQHRVPTPTCVAEVCTEASSRMMFVCCVWAPRNAWRSSLEDPKSRVLNRAGYLSAGCRSTLVTDCFMTTCWIGLSVLLSVDPGVIVEYGVHIIFITRFITVFM